MAPITAPPFLAATTVLALGIRNMRRHGVLICRLAAVETLGAVQTICLYKIGTLTFNRMTVVSVYTGGRDITVSNGTFVNAGETPRWYHR